MGITIGQGSSLSQSRPLSRIIVPQRLNVHRRRIRQPSSSTWKPPVAVARNGGASVELSRVKADIVKLAGDKYGLDKSEDEREGIHQKVAELERLNAVQDLALSGTKWRTVYTTSTTNSSGKIGPFIGEVRQIFPTGSLEGKYFNNVQIGPLTISLLGIYTKVDDRLITVKFENTTFSLGPFELFRKIGGQDMTGSGGHWRMKYVDPDCRVLYSNMDNLFVLKRVYD